jgi:hypothetical protein
MARPACGTREGYQAHQRRGEEPCDPCRAGAAAYARHLRQRSGAVRHPRGGRMRYGADRELLPPHPSLPRCRRGCGRLVWHFDRGLCGACPESEAA